MVRNWVELTAPDRLARPMGVATWYDSVKPLANYEGNVYCLRKQQVPGKCLVAQQLVENSQSKSYTLSEWRQAGPDSTGRYCSAALSVCGS